MTEWWQPPRCGHGNILLGCPHDDCVEQNQFLAEQDAALKAWDHRNHQAARDYARSYYGLPLDTYVCPECPPGEE